VEERKKYNLGEVSGAEVTAFKASSNFFQPHLPWGTAHERLGKEMAAAIQLALKGPDASKSTTSERERKMQLQLQLLLLLLRPWRWTMEKAEPSLLLLHPPQISAVISRYSQVKGKGHKIQTLAFFSSWLIQKATLTRLPRLHLLAQLQ
jgi:hypothetical protein